MDLKAFASGFEPTEWTARFAEDDDLHWKALLRHFRPGKPIVCAVEGYALAGGTEILQATDVRVAGESAVFGITEVTRGLFPLGGSTVRLARQIPYTFAAEMLLTGRHVTAPEAKAMGLIGHVVPDGTALAVAQEIAGRIAANAPLSVQAVLRSLRDGAEMSEAEGLAHELELGWPVFATADAKEGATAFKEKRPPVWSGR
jgi:enoyl-CoA hydratase